MELQPYASTVNVAVELYSSSCDGTLLRRWAVGHRVPELFFRPFSRIPPHRTTHFCIFPRGLSWYIPDFPRPPTCTSTPSVACGTVQFLFDFFLHLFFSCTKHHTRSQLSSAWFITQLISAPQR